MVAVKFQCMPAILAPGIIILHSKFKHGNIIEGHFDIRVFEIFVYVGLEVQNVAC